MVEVDASARARGRSMAAADRREGLARRSARRRARAARSSLARRRTSRRRTARTAPCVSIRNCRRPRVTSAVVGFLAGRGEAEPSQHRGAEVRAGNAGPKPLQRRLQRGVLGERQQAFGQPRQVPEQRLGLAAEGVEAGLVEIGGGEAGVVGRQEAPRAVVEALAGDVDVVGVEHAVDEAGRHPVARRSRPRAAHDLVEEAAARASPRRRASVGHVGADRMVEQRCDVVGARRDRRRRWKRADADVAVASRTSTEERVGEGSSPRISSSPVSIREKALRGVDAERLQHLGREDLAHAALQRQPAVAGARPGRAAEPLVPRSSRRPSSRSCSCAKRKPRPSPRSGL